MKHPSYSILALLVVGWSLGCSPAPDDRPSPNAPDVGPDAQTADCGPACSDTPCVGAACGTGCETDDDCGPESVCEAAACIAGCRYDGACSAGEICADLLCVEGCRDPADCARGHTCRANLCVFEGCAQDSECGTGGRCQDGECVQIGPVMCETDAECGYRWNCLSDGLCHDRACLAHIDCPPDDWCRVGICEARANQTGSVRFERLLVPEVAAHITAEVKTYGAGGALFDLDADGDEDLFLGGTDPELDSPPCVYRNVSTPGAIDFEPVPELCGFHLGHVISAGGVDVDGDGHDELLLLGHELQTLLRFHPVPESIDLREALPPNDPRRACLAGAYAATDVDHDGRIDLIIGCQSLKIPRRIEQHNFALRQTADGSFAVFDGSFSALDDDGVTLAVGVVDIDDDGLLDITFVNDTFVKGGSSTNHLTTGSTLFRCEPGAECVFDGRRFAEGTRAWGSFMGVGTVNLGASGPHVYVTDWGANRMLRFDDRTPTDVAAEHRVDLGTRLGLPLFAWSVLVDDFDRNGLDDMLITQGSASPDAFGGYTKHRDVVLLQSGDGDFLERSDEVGLEASTHEDSRNPARVYSSRGAVRADLDGDGYLEFIVTGLEGVTKVFTERPSRDNAPDRCTLLPRPRIVPGYGVGYAVRYDSSPAWHRRDMQGQPRFGSPSSILTSRPNGELRFPSGAIVPFDCSGLGLRVQVTEPNWITVDATSDEATVRLDAPWAQPGDVEIAIRRDDGSVRLVTGTPSGAGTWVVPIQTGDVDIMVRPDDRWVARWWRL